MDPSTESTAGSVERYARMLMAWSGGEAARQDSRGRTLIVYDPHDALRSFNTALRTLSDQSQQDRPASES